MKEITKKEFTGIFKEEFENFLRYKKTPSHLETKSFRGSTLLKAYAFTRYA